MEWCQGVLSLLRGWPGKGADYVLHPSLPFHERYVKILVPADAKLLERVEKTRLRYAELWIRPQHRGVRG